MMHNRNRRTPAITLHVLSVLALVLTLVGCGSQTGDESDSGLADDHSNEEGIVELTASVLEEFNIEVSEAAPGILTIESTFPGEIRVNQDRFAHIVPRVSGVVHSVSKSVGDPVSAGDVLAILDSRELADIKSSYLASVERLQLRTATFSREEQLYEQNISSQQEFLDARQEQVEAQIALRSNRQKLLALGFSETAIERLPIEPEHALVHYELIAPFDGVIIERHISEGEAIPADADAFALADLNTVWVDLSVFQKDLDFVEEGQKVQITTAGRRRTVEGTIDYVQPIVGEKTRTSTARIVLDNGDGSWKPGVFVTGVVTVAGIAAPLVVTKSALISIGDETVVFVQTDYGFRPQAVTVGQQNATHAAIESGIEPGVNYVSKGGFALKAELEKGELSDGHGH